MNPLFEFRGQCYTAAGNPSPKCTCGRVIRNCFIIWNGVAKVTIGSCCFQKFREVNPTLYKQLEGAKIWLETTVDAERQDVLSNRTEVRDKMAVWRALKHQALLKIREYKRSTGKEWLPESLFELKVIVEKAPSPTATARWYSNRIQELSGKVE
jgi:hypothetical protein